MPIKPAKAIHIKHTSTSLCQTLSFMFKTKMEEIHFW